MATNIEKYIQEFYDSLSDKERLSVCLNDNPQKNDICNEIEYRDEGRDGLGLMHVHWLDDSSLIAPVIFINGIYFHYIEKDKLSAAKSIGGGLAAGLLGGGIGLVALGGMALLKRLTLDDNIKNELYLFDDIRDIYLNKEGKFVFTKTNNETVIFKSELIIGGYSENFQKHYYELLKTIIENKEILEEDDEYMTGFQEGLKDCIKEGDVISADMESVVALVEEIDDSIRELTQDERELLSDFVDKWMQYINDHDLNNGFSVVNLSMIRCGLTFCHILLKDLSAAKEQLGLMNEKDSELEGMGIDEHIIFVKNLAYYAWSFYFRMTGQLEKSFWSYNKAFCYSSANTKEYEDKWDKKYNLFLKHLLNEEKYLKRKFICTLDNVPPIDKVNTVIPVSINNLGSLKFPPSHPILKGIYVGHPFVPNRYYPIDTYEETLFESKVMELNAILQALGATKIGIERIEGEGSGDFKSKHIVNHAKDKMEGGASGSYLVASGSVKGGLETEHDISSKASSREQIGKSKKMMTEQSFAPKIKPHLPEGVIWFDHEETWEQLAKQRMSGEILKSEITMTTESLQLVNKTDVKNIADDFKMFAEVGFEIPTVKADVNFHKEKQTSSISDLTTSFNKGQNTIWKIYVEFAPKSELLEDPSTAANAIPSKVSSGTAISDISENEKEYLEMLNDVYEDGVISDDERRMLNKRRDKLRISEARATEFEARVKANNSNLNDDELDYLEMLKDAYEDGVVSEDERRMLNKRKQKLGISDQRAREIEDMI